MRRIALPSLFLMIAAAGSASAQLSTSAEWATHFANAYRVLPNVTYLTASNVDLKLDVYQRNGVTTPQPTLVFMHGGFWVGGAKESSITSIMPWLEMGWNVVNVEYRLGRVAQAPAALEDTFCALKFVATQAKTYNVDLDRIVVSGESAGGHLALSLGVLPACLGMDRECAGATPMPKVAAVVNFYGVTDVPDVIDGPHAAAAAMRWFGAMPNRMELAKLISPINYVRADLPPILTIHGDADTTVPYDEAVRMHAALAKAGAKHQLVTIPGGRHGGFTPEQRSMIFTTIREFLAQNGLSLKP